MPASGAGVARRPTACASSPLIASVSLATTPAVATARRVWSQPCLELRGSRRRYLPRCASTRCPVGIGNAAPAAPPGVEHDPRQPAHRHGDALLHHRIAGGARARGRPARLKAAGRAWRTRSAVEVDHDILESSGTPRRRRPARGLVVSARNTHATGRHPRRRAMRYLGRRPVDVIVQRLRQTVSISSAPPEMADRTIPN